LVSKKLVAVIEVVAVQGTHGFSVAALAQGGDESPGPLAALNFYLLGRGVECVDETRDDKILERGLALGGDNFGPVKDFLRKVDGSLHEQYLQVYGDMVKT
jgi:hypothetical protein